MQRIRIHLPGTGIQEKVCVEPTPDKPGISFAAPTTDGSVDHSFTIRVDDCRGAYGTLRERGAKFLTPPYDWSGEIRCFFPDPDGHLFEISQLT